MRGKAATPGGGSRSARVLAAGVLAAACLGWAGPARGAWPTTWVYDGLDNWAEISRWTAGLPGTSRPAVISTGLPQITSSVVCSNITVDDTAGLTFATVEARPGSSLNAGNMWIGYSSGHGGAFNQWGGTVTPTQVVLGVYAGARGGYLLSDGTLTTKDTWSVSVGSAGEGELLQTGGAITTYQLSVGQVNPALGGTGRYDMFAGSLDAGTLRLGRGVMSVVDNRADVRVGGQMQLEPLGALNAVPGTRIRMNSGAGYVVNRATDPARYMGLSNVEFAFGGGTARQGLFEIGSADLGADPAGYVGNFAIDALHVGGADGAGNVRLLDNTSNQPGSDVLYARRIIVEPGSTLDLANRTVYTGALITDPLGTGADGTVLNAGNLHIVAPGGPFGDAIAGGGGKTFRLDEGAVFGDGTIETDGLSAVHRLLAAAGPGDEPDAQFNSITRRFTFERDDGLDEPAPVFLGGWLDGLLDADHEGVALVEGTVTLKDAGGVILDEKRIQVQAGPGSIRDFRQVHELVSLEAPLTPGQTYEVSSTLVVRATSNGGTALGDFQNSWDVAISGTPVPEPAGAALLAVAAPLLMLRRRKR